MTGFDFPTRRWRGIEAEDPPLARADHAELFAMAEHMLATRRRRFPVLVRARQMEQSAADAELAAFEALAADWRWIVAGQGEPVHLSMLAPIQQALAASLDTISAIARDQGGFSADLARQAQLVIALAWHAELPNHLALHRSVRLTHELRARARLAARPFCPACERRAEDPATTVCTRTDCGLPRTFTAASAANQRKAA